MIVVSTLVNEPSQAYTILEHAKQGSLILLPEEEKFGDKNYDQDEEFAKVSEISERRNLFVVINKPMALEGLRYDSMIGIDRGSSVFTVRKYHLFEDETDFIARPPKPEPIVSIWGKSVGIAICYEISKIGGYGRMYDYGKIFQAAEIEVLLMPAVWEYNWHIPQVVARLCFKNIPSLKLCAFSSSNLANPKSYAAIWRRDGQGEVRAIITTERNAYAFSDLL